MTDSRRGSIETGQKSHDVAAGSNHRRSILAHRGTVASTSSKQGLFGSRTRLTAEYEDGLAANKRLRTRNAHIKRYQQLIENSRAKPNGVIGVHIKLGQIHSLDPEGEIFSVEGGTVFVYLRMVCVDYVKYTRVYEVSGTPTTIIFDELKHFYINIGTMKPDSFCFIRFEIMAYEEAKTNYHHVFATKEISLLQVIRCQYGTATIDLWRDEKLIAEIDVEICFANGAFGFGYSSLFEIADLGSKKQLAWSMFCRLSPPFDRAEQGHGLNMAELLVGRTVNRPTVIWFTRPAIFRPSTDEKVKGTEWSYPLVEALLSHRLRPRQVAFSQLKSRHDRLQALRDFVIHPFSQPDEADFNVVTDSSLRRTTFQTDETHLRYSLFSSDPDRKRMSRDVAQTLPPTLPPLLEKSPSVIMRRNVGAIKEREEDKENNI